MQSGRSTNSGLHQATHSKRARVAAGASTAFASTINGESASAGLMEMRGTWRSSTITEETPALAKKLAPIPPGEILFEEFMRPLGVSRNRLARDLDIPVSRVSDIVRGRRGITADTALRLAEYFGTSPEMWLNL